MTSRTARSSAATASDAEKFYRQLKGVLIDDAQLFNDRLQEWQDFYNYHRPHGSLGGQTPYERLLQKTTTTPAPEVNDLPQLHTVRVRRQGLEPRTRVLRVRCSAN